MDTEGENDQSPAHQGAMECRMERPGLTHPYRNWSQCRVCGVELAKGPAGSCRGMGS
jgi:hypothetical protein